MITLYMWETGTKDAQTGLHEVCLQRRREVGASYLPGFSSESAEKDNLSLRLFLCCPLRRGLWEPNGKVLLDIML